METKEFATPVVVTVATGRLCCKIGDLYDILIWTLDDPGIMTHQLPAASRAIMDPLYEMFPWLLDLELPPGGGEDFTEAVARIVDEHGGTLSIPRFPDAEWKSGRALDDLVEMVGPDKIIPVIIPDS